MLNGLECFGIFLLVALSAFVSFGIMTAKKKKKKKRSKRLKQN